MCVHFFKCLCRPPLALTLFYCMERFHGEPLPFSQAVLGQYQCCAPELGRGQKLALALVLGILPLLCCGQALLSYSSLATGAGDGCHLAKSLPRNLSGPTLVVEGSHQRGSLIETLLSRCPCLPLRRCILLAKHPAWSRAPFLSPLGAVQTQGHLPW